MKEKSPKVFLNEMVQKAEQYVVERKEPKLACDISGALNTIVEASEAAKGVLTVTLTSLVYKIQHPEQDIRCHQSGITGGYSGRTFDTHYITPFLKEQRFPAMAESGWLTRSLEQKMPYDLNYPGAIRPLTLKQAFLKAIDVIEHSEKSDLEAILLYCLALLISKRERNKMVLAVPHNLTITQILQLLTQHFSASYKYEGASRLPVLAFYAIYQVLQKELSRYQFIHLLTLESHTSADRRSGRMGDIDLVTEDEIPFEAVEIKFGIPIRLSTVETAFEKIMNCPIKRYYILSTVPIVEEEKEAIGQRIIDIKNTHGCQIIVNGVYPTLKYYLRLLAEPTDFLKLYTDALLSDSAIKYEHKQHWNTLVLQLAKGSLV